MADVKLSQLAAQSPASRAAGAALWTHKGHIEGLKMEWVSGTSLRVTSGSAYIESLGYAIDVPAAITKSSLVLTASTWYHVYLFDNAGVADIEIVTDAPAAPYNGTARSKTGDASRRYLGSVLTNTSAEIRGFHTNSDFFMFTGRTGIAPNQIVANGAATTRTTVSTNGVVPLTSRTIMLRMAADASSLLYISNSEAQSFAVIEVPAGQELATLFPLDSAGALDYFNANAPTVGANLYVLGFYVSR